MSRLGDYEAAIIEALEGATHSGNPVFKRVRGVSGGYRPLMRDAIRRERMPVAFVAFIEEPTAPEVSPLRRGPHFAVMVAARNLREDGDPRSDDVDNLGAFTAMEEARAELDDLEFESGVVLRSLGVKFLDADDRVAVYELLYRVWPVVTKLVAPNSPEDLQATVESGTEDVELAWGAPTTLIDNGDIEFYKVYRKRPAESSFVLQAAVSPREFVVTLPDQPTGESLTYYVVAANEGGESDPSNSVVVVL